jgi:pyruvate/2-oxoglutarate dehydrogenase complex dihydrolipoamide dehydrogenase (E3) component
MSNKPASPTSEQYDIVILGSGEGGKYLAWTFGKEGKKVALVEQKYIGGSCPNIACLPSKNVIHGAKVASHFFRSEEFGITKDNVQIHMPVVRERKRKMVQGLVDVHLANYKASGTDLIMGHGRFISPKTIEVALNYGGTRIVRGENVIIGTGTHATIPDTPGLREANPLTHVEALELDHVPGHLIVIGAGFVGLELSQAMRRFGSRVTVIDHHDRLVHAEDEDVSEALQELFRDEGIDLVLGAHVRSVEGKSGQSVKVHTTQGATETTIDGTDLLVASGRTPNTSGFGLDVTGVELTSEGYIKVNEHLQTTAPNVWAVGECAGSPKFTHISFDDFRVIHSSLTGGKRVTTGRQVPFCMFTDPEFARVGLNETEAKAKGIPYRLAKIPMAKDLRTRTLSETRGFMKALVDSKTDRILGITVFGYGGGEIMSAVQIAMIANLPYTALRDAIIAHPTLVEGINALFAAVPPVSKTTPVSKATPASKATTSAKKLRKSTK